jgi:hypothetical protein
LCSRVFNTAVPEDYTAAKQVTIQLTAAVVAAVISLVGSFVLVKLCDLLFGFITEDEKEIQGLDRSEHGETGFDFGFAAESLTTGVEPRAAKVPPGGKRFAVVLEGIQNGELLKAWSDLCQPGTRPEQFTTVYPYVTTVQGNRFTFRGGEPEKMRDNIEKLFQGALRTPVKARIEN